MIGAQARASQERYATACLAMAAKASSAITGASEPGGFLKIRVASYNFGLHQTQVNSMFDAGQFNNTHKDNFQRVVARIFEDGNLDCLAGCEIGAHFQGLAAARLDLQQVLAGVLPTGVLARSTQNYMTIWDCHR